jgi:hypothetical protein
MNFLPPIVYFGLHWGEQLRAAPTIVLTDAQESELTRLARSTRTSVRLAQHARIVLPAAEQGHRRATWHRARTSRALARALPGVWVARH